ncbi:MAG: hypothetical protein PUB51_06795 [Oscillospiraceae bacterium]|nr:hypothetical protein [Oscillospiraceae bacterium]
MKRYSDYMDHISLSDTAREKWKNLSVEKKTGEWKKWGAAAAAVVLVAGAVAIGSRGGGRTVPADAPGIPVAPPIPSASAGVQEIAPGGAPDPVPVSGGGYELREGQVVSYYLLPYINYHQQPDELTADYSLAPPGALSRECTVDDVLALLGGESALKDHLNWGGLEVSGVLWFLEDGTPCAAFVNLSGAEVEIRVELMQGSSVPEDVILPDERYSRGMVWDVEYVALRNVGYAVVDGVEMKESRKLSFFDRDMGHKLTVYGTDAGYVENLCARFFRWAHAEGFDLTALSVDGSKPWAAEVPDTGSDREISAGDPMWESGEYGGETQPVVPTQG